MNIKILKGNKLKILKFALKKGWSVCLPGKSLSLYWLCCEHMVFNPLHHQTSPPPLDLQPHCPLETYCIGLEHHRRAWRSMFGLAESSVSKGHFAILALCTSNRISGHI